MLNVSFYRGTYATEMQPFLWTNTYKTDVFLVAGNSYILLKASGSGNSCKFSQGQLNDTYWEKQECTILLQLN